MANNPFQQTQATKRIAVDPYEIKRQNQSVQLDVVAHPTDPYVQIAKQATTMSPVQENPDVAAFKDIINNVNSTVGSYVKVQELNKPENRILGATDAAKGAKPNKPSGFWNIGSGYTEAYDEMKGKIFGANDYTNAVNQFTQDNSHLPPAEFQTKLQEEVTKPFLSQPMPPHMLAGLIPEAMAADKAAKTHNETRWAKTQEIEKNATISGNIRADITGSIQTTLGVNSLEQLGDMTFATQYYTEMGTPAGIMKQNQVATNLYGMYRNGLLNAKAVGKTTAEYSAEFLTTVSGVATKYGMPELLQYAYKTQELSPEDLAAGKKPDNIKVADAFQEKVEKDITEATRVQVQMKNAIAKQQEEIRKETVRKLEIDTKNKLFDVSQSNDPNRVQQLVSLKDQWRQDVQTHRITPEINDQVNKVLDLITKEGSFAHSSEDKTIVNLYAKGMTLKPQDVMNARTKLEEKDFTKLMQRAWEYENKGMDKALDLRRMALTQMMEGIEKSYTVRDSITGIIDPDSEQKIGQVKRMIGMYFMANPNASAESLQKHWDDTIKKAVPLPTNIYSDNPARPIPNAVAPKSGNNSGKAPTKHTNQVTKTKSGVVYTVE